ncbi:MAG: hypothetical protein ACOX2N_05985 [Peptococcia bacterium]
MKNVFDNLYEEVIVQKYRQKNSNEIEDYHQWEFQEKSLLTEMLKNIKGSRTDAFYALDNPPEINDEIYIHNIQVVEEQKKELLKGVLETGNISVKLAKIWRTIKADLDRLSEFWRDARNAKADNVQLKEYLAQPEKIAKMSRFAIRSPLMSESLQELKLLEKRYFSDSPMEQSLKGIEDIVAENEKMYSEVVEKWRQFNRQKLLLQDMNQRLDKKYGDDMREPLVIKINTAVRNKEQGNKTERVMGKQVPER